ncbi:MAG: ECF transporter S component [Clostridiales bacterium]|nr:ECF transporter S component [Clostridiales bacterium]
MSNNSSKLKKLAYAGVLAAFVFIATQIRVPTAIGYINLGDGVILISSFVLGPIAFFPAAIGSVLSDILAGYGQYVIPTFLIKGTMGYVAGVILRKASPSIVRKLITGIIAEIIMIAGYFAFESLPFMYGVVAAAGSLLFNAIQGVAAIVIFIPVSLIPALNKVRGSFAQNE